LEEVIRELNTAWARDLGIRLELVRWETHAYPSFGDDPQAVINEQIPDDFDLFLGLMWYRFGTPTGRAGSGTLEEFNRGDEGGLYWTFQTIDEFEKLIRLHLTRHVQAWRAKSCGNASVATKEPNRSDADQVTGEKQTTESMDDDGFIDLMEQFEDEFETLTEIIDRIAAATVEIGEKMNERNC
jgi:hypothetical protein